MAPIYWSTCENCVHHAVTNIDKLANSPKITIAAFDLDNTLVTTKTGFKYTKNFYDWVLLPNVKSKIEEFKSQSKYPVLTVIFSNQANVTMDPSSVSFNNLRGKSEGALSAINGPAMFFAAARHSVLNREDTEYRKPNPGMFDLLKEIINQREIDMESSVYVGDAAGRPQDHSADDLNFALNARLTFYTPEEFFDRD